MKTNLTLLTVLFVQISIAQTFSLDADIRPRFEYSHGQKSLIPDGAEPGAAVLQRSRLNFAYKADKIKALVSVQDVSIWGDTRQILPADGNDSFSLFQAWVELGFATGWSAKLGRQVISYDDQRIFGGLDWAMQGRFHDAALVKFAGEKFMMDLGFAFNQDGQDFVGSRYDITGFFSYKVMQYAYLKQNWGKASASFLFLNNGFQKYNEADEADGVFYRQTVGSYFKFPLGDINFSGSGYYQFGKANATTDLSAYQLMLEATYKPENTLFGLGFEMLSGTDAAGDTKNKSFFPLYGTNHKFNGYMDYFYVGNHANSVGLNDLYAKAVFKTGEKSSLLIKGHYFTANADLGDDIDKYLGTEVDVVYTQPLVKNVKLNIGYSHMFAADGMEALKGVADPASVQNWGWAMLVINPNLFKHTFTPSGE
ncbi:alginate export family protein [Abyssalbus ytuae]|uniref:Alginate export family protein n=1 Tax=Abyssalbus ytuae TaxID=2926907 RepID=A0A9E6ZSJ0_9FLAO|nr:alginate export family protein [Abyssalbus ytuae]UOB18063.1 alginate export family protein [Abyssalbus ytuae]